MTHRSGPVAERFASHIASVEEASLSPLARALLRRRRPAAARRRGLLAADALPARPRPDRALQGVSPAEAEDPGVHRPAGRPLPHPAHAHAGGVGHRPGRGPGAAAERGPGRGDRARPRPRACALRPHRRGGDRPCAAPLRPPLPAQPALAADRGRARARRPRPEPDPGGAGRDPQPHRRPACRRRSRAGSCGWSTASPTSTTTSTMRCGRASSTSAQLPPEPVAAAGRHRVGADRCARARPGRALRDGRRGAPVAADGRGAA